MENNGKRILVCNCEGTMPLDGRALAGALGSDEPVVHTQLCRAQLAAFERAASGEAPLIIACTQEAALFTEAAAALNAPAPLGFTNIRERAGWSSDAGRATPKIAALLAEAALDVPPTGTVTLKSEGATLVYGHDERAIEAARRLKSRLDVTVLLTRPKDVLPPRVMDVPVFRGTIVSARGHLGAFEIVVDDYAATVPSSRGALQFGEGRNGATSQCDLVLDLTGGAPLFPAPEKRDGYLRPDPDDPVAVQRALFDLVDLVGEFEKPRYVAYDESICAHARSRKIGCTRCLDACPTSAIRPNGDGVAIDPHICAGCGNCASVCPTGAVSYALPAPDALLQRLRTLLMTYHRAGGRDATLLVHDGRHGEDMISAIARHGDGLPAEALPFAVNETTQIGFDFMMAALAYGAARIAFLVGRGNRGELAALAQQVGLAETALVGLGYGSGRVVVIDDMDPDGVVQALASEDRVAPEPGAFLPMGGKRTITMLALRHLREHARTPVDLLPLPQGAPFGAVVVETAGCTLCLSCVGACPTGALVDNPDKPMLGFQEEACIQCGLCRSTCPEQVISLEPRLNFAEASRTTVVLKEEEPALCVRCGKPFGTKSSIERIVARLAGQHSMFASSAAAERIRMCEDCRVIVQFEAPQPLAGPPRPPPRTTDDELRNRTMIPPKRD